MSQITKTQIESEIQRIAEIIGVKSDQRPTICNSKDGAWPNIEFSANGTAYYEAHERGEQLFSIPAFDLEHLMYMAFKDVTFSMAVEFEKNNRITNKDSRRLLFKNWTELMNTINPEWAERTTVEIESILRSAPFDDEAADKLDNL